MTEKIKIVLVKRKVSVKDLAEQLNCSSQNLSGKFKRDNFSEKLQRSGLKGLFY